MTTANVAEACSSKAANVAECSAFVLKMRKERVKQETASLLSTVARGILPKELAISPPEWFLLADSGANVHVLYDRTLLAFEKEANRFLGWGRGGDTCIAVGQLCCVTYMLHNNRWEKIVLHSGQPDTTWVVPVANRPLFSTIQARRQGHKSIEEGPHPGLQLGGESGQFIPYVSDPHGEFLLLPAYPPPSRSSQVLQPMYQHDMQVLNLNSLIDDGSYNPDSIRAWASPARATALQSGSQSTVKKRGRGEPVQVSAVRSRKTFTAAKAAFDFTHKTLGHCGSMKRLIRFKKEGKLVASQLPPKYLREFRKPCAICLAMKKRMPRRPKALDPQDRAALTPWEVVYSDTSGRFRVRSKLGNRYYSVFVDSLTGARIAIPHAKRKHYPLVYLQFALRIQRHPRVLITDMGGECDSDPLDQLMLAKEVTHIKVPKGEHYANGPAEKAIGDLDQMQRGFSAEANAPSNVWDIITEHATLVDLMTNPSRSDPSMTKFEHLYHVVPNLDLLPPVGCFCVRIQEKKDRIDQKLDPLNLQGTFLGFATIRGCYGSVILTDKGTLVSARHNVAYDEELMPRHDLSATNPRLRALQWLIGRGPDHATSSLPFKASDRTPLQSDIEQAPTADNSANPILPDASHQLDDVVSSDESSDDDEVKEVLSQITPESHLNVPSHSIFPPPKQPIDIMTVPILGGSGAGNSAPENLDGKHDSTAKSVSIRRRKSPRVHSISRTDRSLNLIKKSPLRARKRSAARIRADQRQADFDKILSDFRAEDDVPSKAASLDLESRKRLQNVMQFLRLQGSSSAGNHASAFKSKPRRITSNKLEADKTLVVGKRIKRYFPGFGSALGLVKRFLPQRQVYELLFDDGSIEHVSFDDVLCLLSKSKKRREAEANFASVCAHIHQAMMEAHAANGPHVKEFSFTEPADIFKAWEAPDHAKWREAIAKEMRLLQDEMGCWEIVDIDCVPSGQTLLDSTWVFKVKWKADADGNMTYDKHRARLVAKGFQQRQGIDYTHSFSPTASHVTIRLVMALTSVPGWTSLDLDATCAFISADLPPEEQVYMKAVPGFPLPEGKCLKLRKSIYGLVQAPRAYYLLCKEVYTKCGMTQLASDECVFIRYVQNIKDAPALTAEDIITRGLFKASDQKIPLEQRVYPDCEFSVASMIICMYVDNNGVRTTSRQLVDEFLAAVKADGRILLNLEGDMSWFLSVRYLTDPITGEITADQFAYIATLLNKWGMSNCNPCQLPLKPGQDLAQLPLDATPDRKVIAQYSMLVGELMFLSTNTVPTISHVLHALARYMTNATRAHLEIAKQVLRFLKGFMDQRRRIKWCAAHVKPPNEPGRISAFADSSWADVIPSRKSTYGYYLFVNNAAFSWRAALASILALSTAEAELISICACATEIAYARKLANELGFLQVKPTILYEDNQGAKALAEHTHFKGRSKHYQLRWSFVQDYVQRHMLVIHYCPREHQLADVQTAPRAYPVFERFSKIIYGEV
jgi:hypothetical protein